MPKCTINGTEVEVKEGATIIEAFKKMQGRPKPSFFSRCPSKTTRATTTPRVPSEPFDGCTAVVPSRGELQGCVNPLNIIARAIGSSLVP